MKVLLFMIFFVTIEYVKGQPTIKDYEQKTILISNGKYFINNTPLTIQELVKQMDGKSKEGSMLVLDGYKDFKTSNKLRFVSLGLFVSQLFVITSNQNAVSFRSRRNVGLALFSSSFIVLGISTHFMSKSSNKIARAVWAYNRDVLFVQ